MTRKKVVFVITKSVWGGAQKYVYDLAANLPTDRFDVTVAAGGDGPLFQKLYAAGIRTIHIHELDRDIHIGKELRSFRALRELFERERPDIIHLNSSKVGGLGGIAGRIVPLRPALQGISRSETNQPAKKKMRVIFTVHGWSFLENRSLLWRAGVFVASWASTLFQDTVILINRRDYAAARKFIPRKKRALIHNGIAQHTFMPTQQARKFLAEKTGHKIPPDALLIGTIAELTKNKGLEYLVEAIHRIRLSAISYQLSAVLIGEGEDRKRLEQQIHDLHLEDTVFLLGFVPDAAHYLSGMDIFVLPSVKEGLPYVIMEAMAAGVPVIASNVGGIPDLISHNETGMLVPPKNPEALVEAITLLAQNSEQRTALGKRAREVIRTKFSLHAMLEKTQQLYETTD